MFKFDNAADSFFLEITVINVALVNVEKTLSKLIHVSATLIINDFDFLQKFW